MSGASQPAPLESKVMTTTMKSKMKATNAIKVAATRVRVHHVGKNQYRVDHYDPHDELWSKGNIMNRETALLLAWQLKACAAFELLGIDEPLRQACDLSEYPRQDWRQKVRDISNLGNCP
jgi:hypothetical protein